jgi:phospholipase C
VLVHAPNGGIIAWMCRSLLACTLLASALLGCGGGGAAPSLPLALPPATTAPVTPTAHSHVVVIVMENREYGEVIGPRKAPYVNGLARRSALATNYHAIRHPSLPNYIALIAGDPLGISSDCTDCRAHGAALPDQLEAAHLSWRAYMGDLPRTCFSGSGSRGYAKKHNPFAYLDSAAQCTSVVPLTRVAADLRGPGLPTFAWISPNQCDDGHDCSTAIADRFLARLVPSLLRGLGLHGLLALTWDEGRSDGGCCTRGHGGRVPLILAGPDVRAGARVATPADHYSLLALIEDALGVPRLRGAACACTPPLDAAFSSGTAPHTIAAASAATPAAPQKTAP